MINVKKIATNQPQYIIGLLQAAGVALYVIFFVTLAINFGTNVEHDSPPLFAPMIFLMTFVTSALICGSLILAYPAWLSFKGQIKAAVEVVAWSILWLIMILITVIIIATVL